MSEEERERDALIGFTMLRAKRDWIPESVWHAFCGHPDPAQRLALRWPWRSLLTRDARDADEALSWWAQDENTEG